MKFLNVVLVLGFFTCTTWASEDGFAPTPAAAVKGFAAEFCQEVEKNESPAIRRFCNEIDDLTSSISYVDYGYGQNKTHEPAPKSKKK